MWNSGPFLFMRYINATCSISRRNAKYPLYNDPVISTSFFQFSLHSINPGNSPVDESNRIESFDRIERVRCFYARSVVRSLERTSFVCEFSFEKSPMLPIYFPVPLGSSGCGICVMYAKIFIILCDRPPTVIWWHMYARMLVFLCVLIIWECVYTVTEV